MDLILHAGLITQCGPSGWRGILIEGPSGGGKSDLTLRAMQAGFRLVADDRTLVWASGGALYGGAPDQISGLMEIRGLGVVPQPTRRFSRIALCVRAGTPDRVPEPAEISYLGLNLPLIILPLLESSAPTKLHHALRHLGAAREEAYLGGRAVGVSPRPGGDSR